MINTILVPVRPRPIGARQRNRQSRPLQPGSSHRRPRYRRDVGVRRASPLGASALKLSPRRAEQTTPERWPPLAGFTLLDHTADVGVIATGDTLADALSWAAVGMFSVMVDPEDVQPRESREVSVTSADRGSLVVDWLNELLYWYEAEGFLPRSFDIHIDEYEASLEARCTGEPVDARRHSLMTAIKAATYHDLEVSHDGEWRIQVVLDV